MKTIFLCGPYATVIKSKEINDFIDSVGWLNEKSRKYIIRDKSIEYNIEIAKRAARYLRDKGYNVFCPHVAIAGYCDDWTDEKPEHRQKILEMCAQWIEICDYFATIPEWQLSDGCRGEYAIAEAFEKKIIHLTYGQIGV